MKREHRHVVLVAFGLVLAASAAASGCGHSQRRTDWRNPSQACANDSDCQGGTCAIELGASKGTCSGGGLPPLPAGEGVDGGTRPPGPGPSIQPSSSDIHI